MANWPQYALDKISAAAYEITSDPTEHRTGFDDGAAQVERINSESLETRSINIDALTSAETSALRQWARENAHRWNTWTEPTDGAIRRVHIRGGYGGMRWRSTPTVDGRALWSVEMTIEGLWSARLDINRADLRIGGHTLTAHSVET